MDDLAHSLAVDNRVPVSADPTEKDEAVQYDVSLVQGQSKKRDDDSLRTVDGQPMAMQGKHRFQGTQPLCSELRHLLTALALLNGKFVDRDRI